MVNDADDSFVGRLGGNIVGTTSKYHVTVYIGCFICLEIISTKINKYLPN